MTDHQLSPGSRQSAPPDWLQRDAAWQEQKARLWAMTVDERVRAMNAGKLSMRLCLHWASCRPHEIPLIDGEFSFIASYTPDVAEQTAPGAAPRDWSEARRVPPAASTGRAQAET